MEVIVYNKTAIEQSVHFSGALVRIPGTQSQSRSVKQVDENGKPVIVNGRPVIETITHRQPGNASVAIEARDALMAEGAQLAGVLTDDYAEACRALGIEVSSKARDGEIDALQAEVDELKSKLAEATLAIEPKDDELLLKQFDVIDEELTEAQVIGCIMLITGGETVISRKGKKADAQKLLKDLLV